MPESEVDGVIRAEAAAGRAYAVPCRPVADKRGRLEREVGVERVLAMASVGGMRPPVVPGLLVDAVHAEQLEFAPVDLGTRGMHHSALLVLVKAPARRWENHNGKPGVSEREQFHIPVQRWAIPPDVVSTHFG